MQSTGWLSFGVACSWHCRALQEANGLPVVSGSPGSGRLLGSTARRQHLQGKVRHLAVAESAADENDSLALLHMPSPCRFSDQADTLICRCSKPIATSQTILVCAGTNAFKMCTPWICTGCMCMKPLRRQTTSCDCCGASHVRALPSASFFIS